MSKKLIIAGAVILVIAIMSLVWLLSRDKSKESEFVGSIKSISDKSIVLQGGFKSESLSNIFPGEEITIRLNDQTQIYRQTEIYKKISDNPGKFSPHFIAKDKKLVSLNELKLDWESAKFFKKDLFITAKSKGNRGHFKADELIYVIQINK